MSDGSLASKTHGKTITLFAPSRLFSPSVFDTVATALYQLGNHTYMHRHARRSGARLGRTYEILKTVGQCARLYGERQGFSRLDAAACGRTTVNNS